MQSAEKEQGRSLLTQWKETKVKHEVLLPTCDMLCSGGSCGEAKNEKNGEGCTSAAGLQRRSS